MEVPLSWLGWSLMTRFSIKTHTQKNMAIKQFKMLKQTFFSFYDSIYPSPLTLEIIIASADHSLSNPHPPLSSRQPMTTLTLCYEVSVFWN